MTLLHNPGSFSSGLVLVATPFAICPSPRGIPHLRTDLKVKLGFALFPFILLLPGAPIYAQINQSLCMECLATAKEELKKCLEEAISQEDKKSCQDKQKARSKTCENGQCKIEKAAESGNKSEAVPGRK